MKVIKLGLVAVITLCTAQLFAQSTTQEIKVAGTCGMCKKRIEKAAALPGVEKADWNKTTKELTLVYDPKKVTADKVEKSIAAVGYDTEKYKATEASYKKLPECCQYDRTKE